MKVFNFEFKNRDSEIKDFNISIIVQVKISEGSSIKSENCKDLKNFEGFEKSFFRIKDLKISRVKD